MITSGLDIQLPTTTHLCVIGELGATAMRYHMAWLQHLSVGGGSTRHLLNHVGLSWFEYKNDAGRFRVVTGDKYLREGGSRDNGSCFLEYQRGGIASSCIDNARDWISFMSQEHVGDYSIVDRA